MDETVVADADMKDSGVVILVEASDELFTDGSMIDTREKTIITHRDVGSDIVELGKADEEPGSGSETEGTGVPLADEAVGTAVGAKDRVVVLLEDVSAELCV